MNKEFVTHEQALALKELGFDEKCLGGYVIYSDGEVKISTNQIRLSNIEAPLYQQAFRWFREKHGLIGLVEGGYENGKNIFTYVIWEGFKDSMIDEYFISYEEAEQACLDKLIEIVDGKLKLK